MLRSLDKRRERIVESSLRVPPGSPGVCIYWPAANYTRQPINHGSLTQCSFIFTGNVDALARVHTHAHRSEKEGRGGRAVATCAGATLRHGIRLVFSLFLYARIV